MYSNEGMIELWVWDLLITFVQYFKNFGHALELRTEQCSY